MECCAPCVIVGDAGKATNAQSQQVAQSPYYQQQFGAAVQQQQQQPPSATAVAAPNSGIQSSVQVPTEMMAAQYPMMAGNGGAGPWSAVMDGFNAYGTPQTISTAMGNYVQYGVPPNPTDFCCTNTQEARAGSGGGYTFTGNDSERGMFGQLQCVFFLSVIL